MPHERDERDQSTALPLCQRCHTRREDVRITSGQPFALCDTCWFHTPPHWRPAER
jgi:hypothetical protein